MSAVNAVSPDETAVHTRSRSVAHEVKLAVAGKEVVGHGVVSLTLRHPEGRRLPDWDPGAHIDLVLPTGVTRQYSLCGDRWDAYTYRVGVLREQDGRGGSAYVHDELEVGDLVAVGGPRNNFPLVPSERYLFIAGGIGITPLLPMVRQADLVGADWHLIFGGRTRASMGFIDELAQYGDRVQVCPQETEGLLDLERALSEHGEGARVYVCGPPHAAGRDGRAEHRVAFRCAAHGTIRRQGPGGTGPRRGLRGGARPGRPLPDREPEDQHPGRRPRGRGPGPLLVPGRNLRHLRDRRRAGSS